MMEKGADLFIPGNSLLVVGNGFDIGLHLPTKYTDFMKNFLEYRCSLHNLPFPAQRSRDEEKNKVYSLFKEKMDNWREHHKNNNIDNDLKVFDGTILRNRLILILIFKYNKDELFRFNENALNTGAQNIKGKVTVFPKQLSEDFYRKVEISGDEINWFNLEEILREISDCDSYKKITDCIKSFAGNSCILSRNQIDFNHKNYAELCRGLLFIKSSLSIYLRCVEEHYFSPINQQTKLYFQKICDDLKFRQDTNTKDYSEIISLNYTHSAENLFNITTKYPHGQINPTEPESSQIVLGYYNSTEENNFDTSFIDFQKYYQRILLGTGNYETKDKKISYIDFYGFSCDPADTELIKVILSNHKEARRIRVFCYKDRGQNIINMVKSIGREQVLDLTKNQSNTNQPKLVFELIN